MNKNLDDFTVAIVALYSDMWFRTTNFDGTNFPRSGDIFDQRPILGGHFGVIKMHLSKLKRVQLLKYDEL